MMRRGSSPQSATKPPDMVQEGLKHQVVDEYNNKVQHNQKLQEVVGRHVPKCISESDKRHKVILFGSVVRSNHPDEDELFQFVHQRIDMKITKGYIPGGFLSSLLLENGHHIFLATRVGDYDAMQKSMGPEYQVSWKNEKEVLGTGDGWTHNLDELWTSALSHFERNRLLREETLEYLDADPFVLFGIDDTITQNALLKLERIPALMCEQATPNLDEWHQYLRCDQQDWSTRWVVQAFAETELPKPWTCYKGIGSIVCYVRSDNARVTWKHPFYDYFRQLRDFCLKADEEEIAQVRCNRLLWTYEMTRSETEFEQEPLVSPEYVQRTADIFGYDVKEHGYLVRTLKAQLKSFAASYRNNRDVDMVEVKKAWETLNRDVEKQREMFELWDKTVGGEAQLRLAELTNGEILCVNCEATAMAFCKECKDYVCLSCYDALHKQGARRQHTPFRLVPCLLCETMPAKLQCTFTDKALCHECYAMRHIQMLPPDGKENPARRIDYRQQYRRYAQLNTEKAACVDGASPSFSADATQGNSYSAVLTDWHAFYDARGVKFYHNFTTTERMRQSPRAYQRGLEEAARASQGPDDKSAASPGSTFASHSQSQILKTPPAPMLPLDGFDALNTGPESYLSVSMDDPEARTIKAPLRVHMPCYVPS